MTPGGAAPVGAYVTIVGPDGTGKSTLAGNLERFAPFERCTRAHWRPGILPPLGRFGPWDSVAPSRPHEQASHGRATTAVRLIYYWSDFVLGYWFHIRSRVQNGELYVLERGWSDMLVDRRRYRLSPLPRLERVLDWLAPRPDLTLFLDVPAEVALRRKCEISVAELTRQRRLWQDITARHPEVVRIDGQQPVDHVLECALDLLLRIRDMGSAS